MAIPVGSGLAAQLVVKDEATYGVAPPLTSGVDSFEFNSETLELKKTTVQGQGLAAGKVYARTKRRVLTNYDVSGDIVMDTPTRNLGYWLRYMIGDFTETPTQIGSTGIYKTVFQPVSTLKGHSFCVQKGAPAADNATVEPFTYVGNKLTGWSIATAVGAISTLTLNVDGRNELAGPFPNGGATASGDPLNASTPALAAWGTPISGLGSSVFHFRQATLFTGGTPTLSAGNSITGAPAVPATGVAATAPTGQNALVTITANGATITAVTVNGQQVGIAAGSYLVPPTAAGNGTIAIAYTGGPPTWTWAQAIVSLAGETAAGNIKDISLGQTFGYDVTRIFIGSAGFKAEQIEDTLRAITGTFTVEWLSNEAYYNAFAADSVSSLQLTFTGATVSTSNYLLDFIIPNIRFEGESVKVPGPAVLTQQVNFTGTDDEATVPIQATYQSEDSTF